MHGGGLYEVAYNFTVHPYKHPWNPALQQQSSYRPSDLKDCVSAIHELQLKRKGSSLDFIRNKYKQHKFNRVAELPSPSEIPDGYFESVTNDHSTNPSVSLVAEEGNHRKDLADSFKKFGSEHGSTDTFFQEALELLGAGFHLETSSSPEASITS
ncbi:hypothetical protein AQUCO_03400150v1 [Aquilegia coerulea]|uniref:Cyclin C-terminal domain-containing protein n=1 Tax=Aquilegia coerulea TaxID=218851 RepID=A0A2G5CXV1_AQUCA|nr:hypothetical protein AQUCO_03400150v1 [Aquilegia coerulea]